MDFVLKPQAVIIFCKLQSTPDSEGKALQISECELNLSQVGSLEVAGAHICMCMGQGVAERTQLIYVVSWGMAQAQETTNKSYQFSLIHLFM